MIPTGDLTEAAIKIAPALRAEMLALNLEPQKICFVLGHYRSGTTWVSRLLSAHPQVHWRSETNLSSSLLPCVRDALLQWQGGKYAWSTGREVGWTEIACTLRGALFGILTRNRKNPDQYLLEKSPCNTVLAPFISAVWPEAKFVHIVRDPRDVIVSAWLTRGHSDHSKWESFEQFAHAHLGYWMESEQSVADLRSTGVDFPSVRFETLYADTEAETAKFYDHLGLAYDSEVIAKAINASSFKTVSRGREPGQEDRNDHARKGIPGDWVNHMSAELSNVLMSRVTVP